MKEDVLPFPAFAAAHGILESEESGEILKTKTCAA